MLLLPLWPKDTLKFPLFAAVLIALNILTFLVTWPLQLRQASIVGQDDLQKAAQKMTYILLDADSGISDADRLFLKGESETNPFPSVRLVAFFKQTQSNATALNSKSRYEWDLVYPLFESYQRSTQTNPNGTSIFKQWGFNPDRDWWPGLVTHQFLHEGWIHLFFNMLFLWAVACIAEESMAGHILWLYLAGGIAGALAQAQYGIPDGESLVGASGAISALMGFCLLAKPQAHVKLFYTHFFFVIPRYGDFDCPLWFFLPVWIIAQLFMSLLTAHNDTVRIAYPDHIGGFVFGCLIGLVWRSF